MLKGSWRKDEDSELTQAGQGEHGIGIGKKEALLAEVGVHTMGVMKSIKQALDPHWIMNPGKIMDIPS